MSEWEIISEQRAPQTMPPPMSPPAVDNEWEVVSEREPPNAMPPPTASGGWEIIREEPASQSAWAPSLDTVNIPEYGDIDPYAYADLKPADIVGEQAPRKGDSVPVALGKAAASAIPAWGKSVGGMVRATEEASLGTPLTLSSDIAATITSPLKALKGKEYEGVDEFGQPMKMSLDWLSAVPEAYRNFAGWIRKKLPDIMNAPIIGSVEKAMGLDKSIGQTTGEYWSGIERQWQPEVEKGSLLADVTGAVASVAQVAPGIVASIITKNPNIALNTFFATTLGQTYEDIREKKPDLAPSQALAGGIISGAAEKYTEKLPLEALLNPKWGFWKRLFANMGLEVPGEEIATIVQSGIVEKATTNPDMNVKEFLQMLRDTAVQTLIASPMQVAISHPLIKYVERQEKKIAEQEQQQASQPSPAAITPENLRWLVENRETLGLSDDDVAPYLKIIENATPRPTEELSAARAKMKAGEATPQEVIDAYASKLDDIAGLMQEKEATALEARRGRYETPGQTALDFGTAGTPLFDETTQPSPATDKTQPAATSEGETPNPANLKLNEEWGFDLKSEGKKLYGWRSSEFGQGMAGGENIAGTEGRGQYIAKTEDTAAFFGNAKQVKFDRPQNPLYIDDEPLHILHETEELMEPPSQDDSEWLRINKLAVKNSGTTDENWGKNQVKLQDQLTRELFKAGYDSVYVNSGGEEWLVVLDKKFQEKPGAVKESETSYGEAEPFYSNTADMLNQQGETAMPPAEWKKRIEAWGQKFAGIREENKWSGILDYLDSRAGEKKVPKQDLLDHLEKSKEGWVQVDVADDTRWSSRNLPGGIPGTEKVWAYKLPHAAAGLRKRIIELKKEFTQWSRQWSKEHPGLDDYDPKGKKISDQYWSEIEATEKALDSVDDNTFESSHFHGTPNVVFHMRTQKMLDANGRIGIVAETIQSDWHQEGREKGYKGELPPGWEIVDNPAYGKFEGEKKYILKETVDANKPGKTAYETVIGEGDDKAKLIRWVNENMVAVPPAPYANTWHEAAVKRLIDMAARDPEVEWVGWPTGQIQAERWGKTRSLDNLGFKEYWWDGEKKWNIIGWKDGRTVYKGEKLDDAEVRKLFGDKTLSDIKKVTEEYTGTGYPEMKVNLSIGGDFLKMLYDTKLPKFANNYTKKWGGKVGKTTIAPKRKYASPLKEEDRVPDSEYTIHSLDITPQLRDNVLQKGQAIYEPEKEYRDNAGIAAQAVSELGKPTLLQRIKALSGFGMRDRGRTDGGEPVRVPGQEARGAEGSPRRIVTLGKTISDLKELKSVRLRGTEAATWNAVYSALRIVRNANVEVMHVLYRGKTSGTILYNEAYSCRLPGAVENVSPSLLSLNAVGEANKLSRIHKEEVEIIFSHNHPSGDVTVSEADRKFTKEAAAAVSMSKGSFAGQIVIDHNKYSLIDGQGNANMFDLPDVPEEYRNDPLLTMPVPHKALGKSATMPDHIALIARDINRGEHYFTVLLRAAKKIRGIVNVPLDILTDKDAATKFIKELAVQHGAQDVFAYREEFTNEQRGTLGRMVYENTLRDAVEEAGAASTYLPRNRNLLFGKDRTAFDAQRLEGVPQEVKGKGAVRQVDAWHGSPHTFNKFKSEKIGIGEGNQSFGWGLYFTDLEDVARHYADKLGYGADIAINGKPIRKGENAFLTALSTDLAQATTLTSNTKAKQIAQIYIDSAIDRLENNLPYTGTKAEQAEALKYLKSMGRVENIEKKHSRNLYKVTLHKGKQLGEYNWLEWDKEVPDSIYKKMEDSISPIQEMKGRSHQLIDLLKWKISRKGPYSNKGSELYKELAKEYGSDKEASLFLLRAGIDGIKYPAGSLSGMKTDAFNYVVFDENAVTVEEHAVYEKEGEYGGEDIFDDQLGQYIDGTLPSNEVLSFGVPGGILKDFGFPDANMVMTQYKLRKAKRHGIDLKSLFGLSGKLKAPIAIFKSAKTDDGTIVLITEIRHADGNIMAAIELGRMRDNIEVNDIRSIHPKTDEGITDWLNRRLLVGLERTKGQQWLENYTPPNQGRPQARWPLDGVKIYDAPGIVKSNLKEEEAPYGEEDDSFDFGANIEKAIEENPEKHISLDFKDHLEGYIGHLFNMVVAGEPGKRLMLEGMGGQDQVVSWGSTYPEFMKGQGWSAKEVLAALRHAQAGEKTTDKQKEIIRAALHQATDMFFEDMDRWAPNLSEEALEKMEASIEPAIDDFLSKYYREKREREIERQKIARTTKITKSQYDWEREKQKAKEGAWMKGFKSRQEEVNALQSELAKTEAKLQTQIAHVRKLFEGEKIKEGAWKEAERIKNTEIKTLQGEIKRLKDRLAKAKEEAAPKPKVKRMSRKGQIRIVTGQVLANDEINLREMDALKSQIRMEAAAAREAYRAGNKAGLAKARARYQSMKDILRIKRAQQADIRKMIKQMKDVAKKADQLPPEYKLAITDLLEPWDMARLTDKNRVKLQAIRNEMETNKDADFPPSMLETLKRLDKRPIRDLSYDEIQSIHRAVMHFATLGRNKIKGMAAQQRIVREMTRGVVKGEMKEAEAGSDNYDIRYSDEKKIKGFLQKAKNQFGIHLVGWEALVESVSGPRSMFYKVIYRMVKEGSLLRDKIMYEIEDLFLKAQDAFQQKHGIKDIADWLDADRTIEYVSGKTITMSRNQLISLELGWRDADWRRSVEEGGFGLWNNPMPNDPNRVYQLGPEGIEKIIAAVTPTEREYADMAVPIIQKTGDMLADKFLEINGYEMPRTESGAYWRKDVMASERGKTDEQTELEKARLGRPGIFKGMTIQRTGDSSAVWLKPFTVAMREMSKRGADYVALEEPMSLAAWLMYDKEFRKEFDKRYGMPLWKEIEQGLKDLSDTYQPVRDTTWERVGTWLRNKSTLFALGLNYATMLKQFTGAINYLVYVDPVHLANAIVKYGTNRNDVRRLHKQMSTEYRHRREEGYSQDVGNVITSLSATGQKPSLVTRIGVAGMRPLQAIDIFCVDIGMLAAVDQALDAFKAGKLTEDMKDALDMSDEDIKGMTYAEQFEAAYKWADYCTERTQNMSRPEHMSGWQRGSEFSKQFSMFMGEVQKNLTGLYRAYNKVQRGDIGAHMHLTKNILLYLVVSSLIIDAGVNAMRDILRGRRPDRWWAVGLKAITSPIPIIRDITQTAVDTAQGKGFGLSGGDTPIARFQESIAKVVVKGTKATTGKTAKERKEAATATADAILNTAALAAGLPWPAVQEPFRIAKREETARKERQRNR